MPLASSVSFLPFDRSAVAVFTGALATTTLLACGGGARQAPARTAGTAAPAKAAGGDAAALFARESTATLKPVPISVLEGAVSGTVDAIDTPKVTSHENEQGELVSIVDIPIGTETPITCIFRTGRIDPGAAMAQMIAPISQGDALGGKPFAPEVKVTVEGGVPVLVATSPYVENGVASLGKIAIAPRDGGTVLCSHFEPGYKATFAREVGKIAASLTFTSAPPEPKWHEVRLLEKGTSVAFEERDVWQGDKPGQMTSRSVFATYMEMEGRWTGVDGASSQVYEAKGGNVIAQTTKLAVGGTLVFDSTLTRKGPGKYAYEGKQGNESLSGTFATKTPITSDASRASRVRAWFAGKAASVHFQSYDELDNAKAPMDVLVTRAEAQGGKAKVIVETHGTKVSKSQCTLDGDGLCETLETQDGSKETRLFVRGTL
jgi:hypothetical protein